MVLAEKTGVERHDIALVLGSGWLPAVDALGEATAEISTTDLPGFSAAAVAGHSGKIRSVRSGDRQLLVFLSRTHYYEGKGVAAVVHGVRTAAAGRLPRDRAHQRVRRPQGDLDPRHAGADQGPHQPDRPLPHRGRELRRPHRPLLAAAARHVPRGRPVAGRGRLRAVPRPALRDPRRDRDGARHRRPPRRDEHHAGGDRGARGGHGDPRHQPGHQPGRRHLRRAAQPRGGPRGRQGRRIPDGRAAEPDRARGSSGGCLRM